MPKPLLLRLKRALVGLLILPFCLAVVLFGLALGVCIVAFKGLESLGESFATSKKALDTENSHGHVQPDQPSRGHEP